MEELCQVHSRNKECDSARASKDVSINWERQAHGPGSHVKDVEMGNHGKVLRKQVV